MIPDTMQTGNPQAGLKPPAIDQSIQTLRYSSQPNVLHICATILSDDPSTTRAPVYGPAPVPADSLTSLPRCHTACIIGASDGEAARLQPAACTEPPSPASHAACHDAADSILPSSPPLVRPSDPSMLSLQLPALPEGDGAAEDSDASPSVTSGHFDVASAAEAAHLASPRLGLGGHTARAVTSPTAALSDTPRSTMIQALEEQPSSAVAMLGAASTGISVASAAAAVQAPLSASHESHDHAIPPATEAADLMQSAAEMEDGPSGSTGGASAPSTGELAGEGHPAQEQASDADAPGTSAAVAGDTPASPRSNTIFSMLSRGFNAMGGTSSPRRASAPHQAGDTLAPDDTNAAGSVALSPLPSDAASPSPSAGAQRSNSGGAAAAASPSPHQSPHLDSDRGQEQALKPAGVTVSKMEAAFAATRPGQALRAGSGKSQSLSQSLSQRLRLLTATGRLSHKASLEEFQILASTDLDRPERFGDTLPAELLPPAAECVPASLHCLRRRDSICCSRRRQAIADCASSYSALTHKHACPLVQPLQACQS